MPGFKARPKAKEPTDLITTLTSSPVKDADPKLYQTVFGMITLFANFVQANTEALQILKDEVDSIDTSKDDGIPPFFFMGSS
jgi:hypothetical protein